MAATSSMQCSALAHAAMKEYQPICTTVYVQHAADNPCHPGTLLLKDGSHKHHQKFFETESILSQREKEKTEDF